MDTIASTTLQPNAPSNPDTWADDSLSTTCDSEQAPARLQQALAAIGQVGSLSSVLRLAGAMAVAAAMGIFLLDGVNVDSDLQRFMTMLGFSGALTAAGLAMSLLLKEQRGSRVFIGLSLASIPVNFTVLGALIYSVMPWDSVIGDYPSYASWKVGDLAQLSLAVPLGALVVAAVSWFGYSVMARSERAWLSLTLLASNLLLLIPIRHDLATITLSALSLCAIGYIFNRCGRDSLALKTSEGKIAMAVLAIAPVIMIIRSLFLYQAGPISLLILTTGMYAVTRYYLYKKKHNSVAEVLITLLGACLAIGVAFSLYEVTNTFLFFSYALSVGYFALLALSWDLARKNINAITGRCINCLAIALVAISISLQSVFLIPGVSVLNVAILLSVLILTSRYKLRTESVLAGMGLAVILFFNAGYVWSSIVSTGWWGIALLGALAIVAASLLDRIGPVVQLKAKAANDTALSTTDQTHHLKLNTASCASSID